VSEFHGSPINGLVADIGPQTEGHGLHIRPTFLFCKERQEQAWSTSYVVRATPAKFGLHAGNVKFNTQNEK
jgi:hypothetical protein